MAATLLLTQAFESPARGKNLHVFRQTRLMTPPNLSFFGHSSQIYLQPPALVSKPPTPSLPTETRLSSSSSYLPNRPAGDLLKCKPILAALLVWRYMKRRFNIQRVHREPRAIQEATLLNLIKTRVSMDDFNELPCCLTCRRYTLTIRLHLEALTCGAGRRQGLLPVSSGLFSSPAELSTQTLRPTLCGELASAKVKRKLSKRREDGQRFAFQLNQDQFTEQNPLRTFTSQLFELTFPSYPVLRKKLPAGCHKHLGGALDAYQNPKCKLAPRSKNYTRLK
ncbi:hypothetical protein BDY19DRAFT_909529 [Irpex rosettiformis]|uniref:Uncharacterized protein n=1 Tax=Irpex rosettiformis TaxID=378272 RepID=A0ACB8TSH0_9APHY|nr:hypothetical protein BDY19DRAFT_909529 [Irpex rosettiformis]